MANAAPLFGEEALGRYDELLARFGTPMPAMGFAFDLDSLEWALRAAKVTLSAAARVVVVGPGGDPLLERLRGQGIVAGCARDRGHALAWARGT